MLSFYVRYWDLGPPKVEHGMVVRVGAGFLTRHRGRWGPTSCDTVRLATVLVSGLGRITTAYVEDGMTDWVEVDRERGEVAEWEA